MLEIDRNQQQENRLKNDDIAIDVFTVPMALGANRSGVDLGAALIDDRLRKRLRARGFPNILERLSPAQQLEVMALDDACELEQTVENARHVAPIAEACTQMSETVARSLKDGKFALLLGGDHALSIGSLAAASTLGRLGVIWIDAHGDINTPDTSPSGNVHGMPLAVSLGYGPRELVEVGSHFDVALDDIAYIGVRSLDPRERELLRQSPAMVYTMDSVDTLGINGVTQEAVRRLQERGVDAVHISLDLDVLDPVAFAATGTTSPGGLTYREVRRALSLIRDSVLPIVSADIVEFNPTLDRDGGSASVAAGLTAALLGEQLA
ncbi:MAG: arginase [Chloroflexota bacterium]